MCAYAALAGQKYGLPVYPMLINILPPAANVTICDRYDTTFMGLQARQDYRVINLWEVDAGMFCIGARCRFLKLLTRQVGNLSPELTAQVQNLLY